MSTNIADATYVSKFGHVAENDLTCVPVGVTINKLNLAPNRNMPRFNRDSGIDIPEAWIPTVKQHNSRFMKTYEGTPSNDRNNNEDRIGPITAYQQIATRKQSTSSPDED